MLGTDFVYLGAACDYKQLKATTRAQEDGSIHPSPRTTPALEAQIKEHVCSCSQELAQGEFISGILYAGLLIPGPKRTLWQNVGSMPALEIRKHNTSALHYNGSGPSVFICNSRLAQTGSSRAQTVRSLRLSSHQKGILASVNKSTKGRLLPLEPQSILFSAALKQANNHWIANGGRVWASQHMVQL